MHQTTTTEATTDSRATFRATRDVSLADIAEARCGDVRVAPLLVDLNPGLARRGARAGDVVRLPSRREIARFAARMGFQVGLRPEEGGSTAARRRWAAMRDGAVGQRRSASAAELARVLAGQRLTPDVAARRLLALVDETEARAFASSVDDDTLAPIAEAVVVHLARLDLRARLRRLGDAAAETATPDARRVLLETAARDPGAVQALFAMCLVPDVETHRLVERAPSAVAVMRRAEQLAEQDAHVREVHLSDRDASGLRPFVEALVDGAPLCAGERLALLGVADVLAAIESHTGALAALLRRLVDELEHADGGLVRALEAGQIASLPRPWPVAATLLARLSGRLDRVHAGQVERGLVALALVDEHAAQPSSQSRVETNPRLSVAELRARSAANARVSEAHDGVPERLAQSVVALFDPLRPSTPDVGPDALVQRRRQARFEKATLVGRMSTTDGDVCLALVDELLEHARAHADPVVRRRAERVSVDARRGALAIARRAREPLAVLLRNASEVGRALVVVAIALDAELGAGLARPSGQEAALSALKTHGPRTLALATQQYARAKPR